MPRPSVIPEIKARLESYLDERGIAYQQQINGSRKATLQTTPDGKVNVRALAVAIGLKTTQEKYLYERQELTELVNMAAENQGLLPIGARLGRDTGGKTINCPVQSDILDQLKAIKKELETVKAENTRLRTRIETLTSVPLNQVGVSSRWGFDQIVTVAKIHSTLERGCIFTGVTEDETKVRVKYQGKTILPAVGDCLEIKGQWDSWTNPVGQKMPQVKSKLMKHQVKLT